MASKSFMMGIEIETIVNRAVVDHKDGFGGYHAPSHFTENWGATSDSSIICGRDFESERAVEYVSKTFHLAEMKQRIQEFREYFGDNKLHDTMYFNGSTGAHIHFSFDDGGKISQQALYDDLEETRKFFLGRVKKSTILSDTAKRLITRRYFRKYALEITKGQWAKNLKGSGGDRSVEWNINSEHNGKGLEWRSVNLAGITTWEEFFEVFDIVEKSMYRLLKEINGSIREFKRKVDTTAIHKIISKEVIKRKICVI